MSNFAVESEIKFNFNAPFRKFDSENYAGLKAIDFVVETEKQIYLIEVKNFEQSNAPQTNRLQDFIMLTDKNSDFPKTMCQKLKDSMLRMYAMSQKFDKAVVFLLVIKLDNFKMNERRKLAGRFNGLLPTGLNGLPEFKHTLAFDIPTFEELTEKYGITAIVNN